MSIKNRLARKKKCLLALTVLAAVELASVGTSYAISDTELPQGAAIHQTKVNGALVDDAVIQTDAAVMNIEQNAGVRTGLIDWQSFNIGKLATVNILQHHAGDTLINNVIGNNLSQINGKINATGNVVLVNPNGIIFDGAQINVGGFLASTAPIKITEDSDTKAIKSYQVLENSPFQGNIEIANSMIAAGYSRITTNTAIALPDDFAYDISGLTNQVRVYADGDISLKNSQIFANDYTSVSTSRIEGVEEWDLGTGTSWVSGKAILRTDMNGDDLGSLNVTGTDNIIASRETRLIYNPELVDVEFTTDDNIRYTKKDFRTEIDVNSIKNTFNGASNVFMGANFNVSDSGLTKNSQRSYGSDINAYMLINNMAQLQDIGNSKYGNLNGSYVLGRTLDGKHDFTSYVTTDSSGNKYVHKTYVNGYSDYNGNKISAGTKVLSTDGSYYIKNSDNSITKNLTDGTKYNYNTDKDGNYILKSINTTVIIESEDPDTPNHIEKKELISANGLQVEIKNDGSVEFKDNNHSFISDGSNAPTCLGTRTFAYEVKITVDVPTLDEDGNKQYDDDDVLITHKETHTETKYKYLDCKYTFKSDGSIVYSILEDDETTGIKASKEFNYDKTIDDKNLAQYAHKLNNIRSGLKQFKKNQEAYVTALNKEGTAFDGSSYTNSQIWDEGKGFKPIGTESNPFTGVLTGYIGRSAYVGAENQINNLYINRPDENNVGLFGVVSSKINSDGKYQTKPDGTVLRRGYLEALTLNNASVTGHSNVGALAGQMNEYSYMLYGNTNSSSEVRSTANNNEMDQASNIGGLVGIVKDLAHVNESYNRATVIGQSNFIENGNITNVGGIAGAVDGSEYMKKLKHIYLDTEIENLKTNENGQKKLDSYRAHLSNIRNYGNIFGEKAVGGIAGYADTAQFSASTDPIYYDYVVGNNAQVSGYDYVGGIIGQIGSNININKAYNTNESSPGASNNAGTTSSTGVSVIEGNSDQIEEAVNKKSTYGQITGHSYVGGLIGGSTENSQNNVITNAYNAGNVTGTGDNVGGIAGYFSGANSHLTNVYNGDNNTIIRETLPIIEGTGDGLKDLDALINYLVSNKIGLNTDEDNDEHYIMKYYMESENKNATKQQIADMISYYSFYTIDGSGKKDYYYYIPAVINNDVDRMGAEGIYVNANGVRQDENDVANIHFTDRYYAIREAYRDANITGHSRVGGLVGTLDKGAEIDTAYNAGSVIGDTTYKGALVGVLENKADLSRSFFVKGSDITTGKAFSVVDHAVGDNNDGKLDNDSVDGNELKNLRSGTGIMGTVGTEGIKNFFDPHSEVDSHGNKIYQLKIPGRDEIYTLYLSQDALNVDDLSRDIDEKIRDDVHDLTERMKDLGVSKREYDIYEDSSNSKMLFVIIRYYQNEDGVMHEKQKIFGIDQLNGKDKDHPELPAIKKKEELFADGFGLEPHVGVAISNQGNYWTVYRGQTLPLLNIFMHDADIAREFDYDGTVHNLVTDDVSGVYGRADFVDGAGRNVYTKGFEDISDNGLSSRYYLDNSNIWAPQHGLRVKPTASVIINPIELDITVEGEKIYGMHMLQGYYISVPIYNTRKDLVRYDYFMVGRKDSRFEEHVPLYYNELREQFGIEQPPENAQTSWTADDWHRYNTNVKNTILNNHHYMVTMDGFVNNESIETALSGLVQFIATGSDTSYTGSTFRAAFDNQELGVADTSFTYTVKDADGNELKDESGNVIIKSYYNEDSGAYDLTGSLSGVSARFNNYKINYDGYLKVDKGSLAFTYNGERDYGSDNKSGEHAWYLSGTDTNSEALSINGQLKDWDALKLLEAGYNAHHDVIIAQIEKDGNVINAGLKELLDMGAVTRDPHGKLSFNFKEDTENSTSNVNADILDKYGNEVDIVCFKINEENFTINPGSDLIMMSTANDNVTIQAVYNDNGTINSYKITGPNPTTGVVEDQIIYVKETKAGTVLYTDYTHVADGEDIYANPLTTGEITTQQLLKAGALTYDATTAQYKIKDTAFTQAATGVTGANSNKNYLTTITDSTEHYYACNHAGDSVGFYVKKDSGGNIVSLHTEKPQGTDDDNATRLSSDDIAQLISFGVIKENIADSDISYTLNSGDFNEDKSYLTISVNKDENIGSQLVLKYTDPSRQNLSNYVVTDAAGKVISNLYSKTDVNSINLYSDPEYQNEINSGSDTDMKYIVGIGGADDLYHVLTKSTEKDGERTVADYTLSYLGTDITISKSGNIQEDTYNSIKDVLTNYSFDWRMGGTYKMLSSNKNNTKYGISDVTVQRSTETIKPIELDVNVSGSRDYMNTMKDTQFTVSNGGEDHVLVQKDDAGKIIGTEQSGTVDATWNYDFGTKDGTDSEGKNIIKNGLTGDDNKRKETILNFDNVSALTRALEGEPVTIDVDGVPTVVNRINANTYVKRDDKGEVTVYNLTKPTDNENTGEGSAYTGSLFDVSQMFVINANGLLDFRGKYYNVEYKKDSEGKDTAELDTINTKYIYGDDNKGILSDANKYDYLITAPKTEYTLQINPVHLKLNVSVSGSRYYGQHTSQDFSDTSSYQVTATDANSNNPANAAVTVNTDGVYQIYDGTKDSEGNVKGWVNLVDNIALQNNLGYMIDTDGKLKLRDDYGQKWDADIYENTGNMFATYDADGKLINAISVQDKNDTEYVHGIKGSIAKTGSNGSIANNYTISGLDAKYEIKKADLYYTLAGYREYGEDNSTGIYQYELSGIDNDSASESVNGFLKSFDVYSGEGSKEGKLDVIKATGSSSANLQMKDSNFAGATSFDFKLADGSYADKTTAVSWGKDTDGKDTVTGYKLSSVRGVNFKDEKLKNNYNLVLLDSETYKNINDSSKDSKLSATKVTTTDEKSSVQQENLKFTDVEKSNAENTNTKAKHDSELFITPVEVQLSVNGQRFYGNTMTNVIKNSNFTANSDSLTTGKYNITSKRIASDGENNWLKTLTKGYYTKYDKLTTSDTVKIWSSTALATAYGADDLYARLNGIENAGDTGINASTDVKYAGDSVTSYNISKGSAEKADSSIDFTKNAGNYIFSNGDNNTLKINKRKVYYTLEGSRTYGEDNPSDYTLSFKETGANTGFAGVDKIGTVLNTEDMVKALTITNDFTKYSSAGEYSSEADITNNGTTASGTATFADKLKGVADSGSKAEATDRTISVSGLENIFKENVDTDKATGFNSNIDLKNYDLVGTHNFNIAKKNITLKTDAVRTYGDETYTELKYSTDGLVGDDEIGTTNIVTTEKADNVYLDARDTAYTGSNAVDELLTTKFDIKKTDAFSNNYNIAGEKYSLTVNKANLTIDITGSKTYGDATSTSGADYKFTVTGLKNGETIGKDESNVGIGNGTSIAGSSAITIGDTSSNDKNIMLNNINAGKYSNELGITNMDALSVKDTTSIRGFNADNYNITTISTFDVNKRKLIYDLLGTKTYGEKTITWSVENVNGLAGVDLAESFTLDAVNSALAKQIKNSVSTTVDDNFSTSSKYTYAGKYTGTGEVSTDGKYNISTTFTDKNTQNTSNTFTVDVNDFGRLVKSSNNNTPIDLSNYDIVGNHSLQIAQHKIYVTTTAKREYGSTLSADNVTYEYHKDNAVLTHDLKANNTKLKNILTTEDHTNKHFDVKIKEGQQFSDDIEYYTTSGADINKYITTKTDDKKFNGVFDNYEVVQEKNKLMITPVQMQLQFIGSKVYGEDNANVIYQYNVNGLVNGEKIGKYLENYGTWDDVNKTFTTTGMRADDIKLINTLKDNDVEGYNTNRYLDAGLYEKTDGTHYDRNLAMADYNLDENGVPIIFAGKDDGVEGKEGFYINNYKITSLYKFTVTPKILDLTISGSHTYGDTTMADGTANTTTAVTTDGKHFTGTVTGFANDEANVDRISKNMQGVTVNTTKLKDTDAEDKNTGNYLNAGNYKTGITIDDVSNTSAINSWLTNLKGDKGTKDSFKISNYQITNEHIFTNYTVDPAKLNINITGKKLYGEVTGESSNTTTLNGSSTGVSQYTFDIEGLQNGETLGNDGRIANLKVTNTAKDDDIAPYNSGTYLNATVVYNEDGTTTDTPYVNTISVTTADLEVADSTHNSEGALVKGDFLSKNYVITSTTSTYSVDKRTLNVFVEAERQYGTNSNTYKYTTEDIVGDSGAPDMILFNKLTSGGVTTDSSVWNTNAGIYNSDMISSFNGSSITAKGVYLNTVWDDSDAINAYKALQKNYVIPAYKEKLTVNKADLRIDITGNKIYGETTGTNGKATTLFDKDNAHNTSDKTQYTFTISGLGQSADGSQQDKLGIFTNGDNLIDKSGQFTLTNNLVNANGRDMEGDSRKLNAGVYQNSGTNNLIMVSNISDLLRGYDGSTGDAILKNYNIINSSKFNVAKRRFNVGITATREYGTNTLLQASAGVEGENTSTSSGVMSFESGYDELMNGNVVNPNVVDVSSTHLDVGMHTVSNEELKSDMAYTGTNKDLGATLMSNYVMNKDNHVLRITPVDLTVTITGEKKYGDDTSASGKDYTFTISGLKNGETITDADKIKLTVENALKDSDNSVYNTGNYLDVGNYKSTATIHDGALPTYDVITNGVAVGLNDHDSVKITNWDAVSKADNGTDYKGFNAKNYNIITNYDFTVKQADANLHISGSKTYGDDTQSTGYTMSLTGLQNDETTVDGSWISNVTVNASELKDNDDTPYNSGIYLDAGTYNDKDKKISVDGANMAAVKAEITAQGNSDNGFKMSNYNITSQDSTYVVTPKDISLEIIGSKTYGEDTAYTMKGYTGTFTGLVGDEAVNFATAPDSMTVTNTATDGKDGNGVRDAYLDAGTYSNTVSIADDVLNAKSVNSFKTGNYKITQSSTYTVGKKDMTLITTGERIYGVAAGESAADVNKDIEYNYSAEGLLLEDQQVFANTDKKTVNSTVATSNAGKYGTENGGSQVLTSTLLDKNNGVAPADSISKNYNVKEQKDDFTINKADLSVTVTGSKVYGQEYKDAVYNIDVQGLRNGENIANDNVTNNTKDKDDVDHNSGIYLDVGTYGDVTKEDTAAADDKLLLRLDALFDTSSTAGYNLDNYNIKSYVDQFDVSKKDVSLKIIGNKTYGDDTAYTMKGYKGTFTGLVGDEAVNFVTAPDSMAVTNTATDGKDGNGVRDAYLDAGTYSDTINIVDAVLNANAVNSFKTGNYNITQSSTYTVDKKDMTLITKGERTYGIAAGESAANVNNGIEYTYSAKGLLTDDEQVFDNTDKNTVNSTVATSNTGKYGTENGGNQVLTSTLLDKNNGVAPADSISKNYNVSAQKDDFTINKADLYVTVTGSKVYGQEYTDAVYDIDVQGLRNGEMLADNSVTNNAKDFDDDDHNSGIYLDVGTYGDATEEDAAGTDDKLLRLDALFDTSSDKGYNLDNYNIKSYKDQFDVSKKDVTLEIIGNKTYGDDTAYTMKGYKGTFTGLVGDEAVNFATAPDSMTVTNTATDGKDGNGVRDAYLDAGTYSNTVSIADDVLNAKSVNSFKTGNYKITQNSTYTVDKKDMTLITKGERTYGIAAGESAANVNNGIQYTYSAEGLLADDKQVFDNTDKNTSNSTTAWNRAGIYGTDNDGNQVLFTTLLDGVNKNDSISKNYSITSHRDDFKINKAPLYVHITGEQIYGSDDAEYWVDINGLRNGEVIDEYVENSLFKNLTDEKGNKVPLEVGTYGDINSEDTSSAGSKMLELPFLWKLSGEGKYSFDNYDLISYRNEFTVKPKPVESSPLETDHQLKFTKSRGHLAFDRSTFRDVLYLQILGTGIRINHPDDEADDADELTDD